MPNDTVDSLNLLTLQQVPEPFFREYADHYRIESLDNFGVPLDDHGVAAKILFAAGTGNPLEIPVLATHAAKLVDGVLHVRYRTAVEYADPEVVGAFPIEHLPDPEDDYSDDEVAQKGKQKQKSLWGNGKVKAKARKGLIKMDFVFPPQGRRMLEPTEEMLKYESAGYPPMREPLPEDFLGAMMDDLKRESELAVKTFYKAEDMLKEAMYAYECARLEMEEEQRAWHRVWADVESVAGKRVVDNCIHRAALRVTGEIPPDEVDRAIAEGEIPDLKAQTQWKSRVAAPESAPPSPQAPAPRVHAPAPASASSPAIVVPTLLPPISLGLITFGGNATSFDQGPFLKRRRDSDVSSDSDSDESEARLPSRASWVRIFGFDTRELIPCFSSAHKRSRAAEGSPVRRPPPGLVALTSPPEKRQPTPPRFKAPQRQATVRATSTASRSTTASVSPRYPVVPELPAPGSPSEGPGRQASTKKSARSRSVTRSVSLPYPDLPAGTR